MQLYDMHCHIDLVDNMVDFALLLEKMGIGAFTVTTTPKAFEVENRVLKRFSNLKVGLGLHPQLISSRYDEIAMIERYIHNQKYIGEIGLDYGKKFYFSKERQKIAFEKIMYMCSSGNKVISIHSAFAASDVLEIISKYNSATNNVCILHWFSGTNKQLQKAIELGCYFSINESMLQRGNLNISQIPVDRILVETDYPFISRVRNSQEIYDSLLECLRRLNIVMGKDIMDTVSESSKKILL